MSYLSDLADQIKGEVPREAIPENADDLLFLIYAVLLLAKGTAVGREDVHNAWSAWMTHRGEGHESLVPFNSLAPQTKQEDDPYVLAIKRVAGRVTS